MKEAPGAASIPCTYRELEGRDPVENDTTREQRVDKRGRISHFPAYQEHFRSGAPVMTAAGVCGVGTGGDQNAATGGDGFRLGGSVSGHWTGFQYVARLFQRLFPLRHHFGCIIQSLPTGRAIRSSLDLVGRRSRNAAIRNPLQRSNLLHFGKVENEFAGNSQKERLDLVLEGLRRRCAVDKSFPRS